MSFPAFLVFLGALIALGAKLYDDHYGRAEEYGPLDVLLLGAVIALIGAFWLLGKWLVALLA